MSFKTGKKVVATSHHGNTYEGKITEVAATEKGEWFTVACSDGKTRKFRASQLQLA